MNKKKALMIVNVFLALSFVFTAMGGLLRNFAPDAMPYDQFRAIHPKFGIATVVLVTIHLVLNWGWVKNSYFMRKNNG
jgi:cytochrome b561